MVWCRAVKGLSFIGFRADALFQSRGLKYTIIGLGTSLLLLLLGLIQVLSKYMTTRETGKIPDR